MVVARRWGNQRLARTLLALLACAGIVTTRAQTITGAQDRAQMMRNQPSLRDEETEPTGADNSGVVATPNDPDLGEQQILKRSDSYQPWTIVVAAPISYTSNVALTPHHVEGDALFTPSFAVLFVPRITGNLYATFTLSQQYFYYATFSELNFGSFDARAGLTYTVPQLHNLYLRAEYDFNRLTTDSSMDEFFADHAIDLGAEVPFPIGRAQQITAGVDARLLIHSDPSLPGRDDFSLFIGYTVNLTRNLTGNAVARLAVRNYVDVDRTDVSGIFSLGATYHVSKWFSVSAVSSFATNDSNIDVFDYNVFNIGGAVSGLFRF
jgi:hypothetical protein